MEKEEARHLGEEEIERNHQAATEVAIAKGLITSDQTAANNKIFFTIDADDNGNEEQITNSSRTKYFTKLIHNLQCKLKS